MTLPVAAAGAEEIGGIAKSAKAAKSARAAASSKSSTKHAAQHSAGSSRSADAKQLIGFPAAKTKDAIKFSFNNPAAPKQRPTKSVVTYRHTLALEYWIGIIAILTDKSDKDEQNHSTVVQLASFTLVFAILFGFAGVGRDGAKFCAQLGGLITLTLVMYQEAARAKNKTPSRFGFMSAKKHTDVKKVIGNEFTGPANSPPPNLIGATPEPPAVFQQTPTNSSNAPSV